MHLTHLVITEFPGIPEPREYTFPELITVVHGPNASGKTSSARAIFALFDTRIAANEPVSISATFTDNQHEYTAKRRGNTVSWQKNGKRTGRPNSVSDLDIQTHFLTVKNLLSTANTESELEQQVLIELTGGVDLKAIERRLTTASRSAGQREATELRNATKRVQKLVSEREQLAEREQQLAPQRQRLREKRALLDEQPLLELAQECVQLREKLATQEALRPTLPPVHEALSPDRLENLAQRLATHEKNVARLNEVRTQCEALTQAISGTQQIENAVERLQLALAKEDTLHELRIKQQYLASTVQAAEHALHRKRQVAMQQSVQHNPALLHAPNLENMFVLIERADQRAAELGALRERVQVITNEIQSASTDTDTAELERNNEHLARWLRAQPAGISVLWPAIAWLVVALFVAGIWLAWPVPYTANVVLSIIGGLVGAGAFGTAVWSTAIFRADAHKRQLRSELAQALGHHIPTEASASELLARGHEEIAARRQHAAHLRELQAHKTVHEQNVASAEAAHASALAELSQHVGYDVASTAQVASGGLHLRLQLELHEATEAFEVATAEHNALQSNINQLLQEQENILKPFQFPISVSKRLLEEQLETERQHIRQQQELTRLEQQRQRLANEVKNEEEQILHSLPSYGIDVHNDVKLSDIASVLSTQRENWPAFEAWRNTHSELAQKLAYNEQQLAKHPHILALQESEIADRLANMPATADQVEELQETVSRTEVALDSAKRDRAIERARQAEQEARQELTTHQLGTLADTAVQFVIDDVIRTSYEEQEPRTLSRAAQWFRAFTNGAFELRYRPVQPGQEANALSAWDVQRGEERSLTELSSGTLSQLLLAARIGFALEREAAGAPVIPFVLDEALGTADNERFRAVANSLHLFSTEASRQLLYLSARAEDMHAWKQVHPAVHIITLSKEG